MRSNIDDFREPILGGTVGVSGTRLDFATMDKNDRMGVCFVPLSLSLILRLNSQL